MYRILFFIHKTADDKLLSHLKESTFPTLAEITGKPVMFASVESNLLTDQKYSYYFEAEFKSKEEMDQLMMSKAGMKLNKDLMNFHNHLTVISVNSIPSL